MFKLNAKDSEKFESMLEDAFTRFLEKKYKYPYVYWDAGLDLGAPQKDSGSFTITISNIHHEAMTRSAEQPKNLIAKKITVNKMELLKEFLSCFFENPIRKGLDKEE